MPDWTFCHTDKDYYREEVENSPDDFTSFNCMNCGKNIYVKKVAVDG